MKLIFTALLIIFTALASSMAMAKPLVGDKAPIIDASNMDNIQINTNKINEAGLEIVFLDSLCPMPNFPNCEERIEILKKNIKEESDKQWIGVLNSYYVDQAYAADWLKRFDIAIPVIFDADNTIFKAYGVFATPYRVSVSPKGIITERGPIQ